MLILISIFPGMLREGEYQSAVQFAICFAQTNQNILKCSVTQKVGGFVSKSGKKKKMNKRRSSSQVSVIFVHVIDDLRKHSTVCRQTGEG